MNQAIYACSFRQKVLWWWVGGIAVIVTSSRLQVTLRVETCVELELSLPESDLEMSLLINLEVFPVCLIAHQKMHYASEKLNFEVISRGTFEWL